MAEGDSPPPAAEKRKTAVKLNCLSCGHSFDLRDAYDDYEGQVKCYVCGAMLDVRTEEGQVKSVHMKRPTRPVVARELEPTFS